MMIAAENAQLEIVRYLKALSPKINPMVLSGAIRSQDLVLINEVLSYGVPVNHKNVIEAYATEDEGIIRRIKSRTDIRLLKSHKLQAVAFNDHHSSPLFTAQVSNVDTWKPAFQTAIAAKNYRVVEHIIRRVALQEVDSLFEFIIKENKYELIVMVLERYGLDITAGTPIDWTTIFHESDFLKILQYAMLSGNDRILNLFSYNNTHHLLNILAYQGKLVEANIAGPVCMMLTPQHSSFTVTQGLYVDDYYNHAIAGGAVNVCDLLFGLGHQPSRCLWEIAARWGQVSSLKWLSAKGISKTCNLIVNATRSGNVSALNYIVRYGLEKIRSVS
jgi:hypothetical protein